MTGKGKAGSGTGTGGEQVLDRTVRRIPACEPVQGKAEVAERLRDQRKGFARRGRNAGRPPAAIERA